MKVWLVTVGEPLPLPGEDARLWRCGLLAKTLMMRGHQVVWWTSTFDHIRKRYFGIDRNGEQIVLGGVRLRGLHGLAYDRNLSVRRLFNHAQLSVQFDRQASAAQPRPDVIVTSFPTIELSWVAARLAGHWGCPLVVDVRDLWPDIFLDAVPRMLRLPARALLAPYFAMTRTVMREARSLVAVSRRYLDWGLAVAGRAVRPADGVFPLGYEPSEPDERDREEVRRQMGCRDGDIVAVFAGSFGRTYDLVTVIRAAGVLQSSGVENLRFVLCGTGERERELRALAQGLPNVVFTGLLSARRLAAVFERSAFGLAAYERDAPQGIPNKLIEYSCAGLAIVSSLAGEAEDLIGSAGCGVSYLAGDHAGLVMQMRRMLLNPEGVAQMRRRSGELYRSRFAATDVYALMADHVERVAENAL